MTEVDRDIALVLLKRLWKRELISERHMFLPATPVFLTKDVLPPILELWKKK